MSYGKAGGMVLTRTHYSSSFQDCNALVDITLGPGKTKPRKNEAELNVHISISSIEQETENPFYVLLKKGANSLENILMSAM
ncbi:hypothetical protein CDAR_83091 [Caerostris darwini]|uniref:Uncharacterized protein n=1 Tax=Caerostris darwini TaxID=1538125 RepID=A0AAV4NTZ4_9ARAC|nr:hypothetical protein CDAR_83091 [Caerostris darwini]